MPKSSKVKPLPDEDHVSRFVPYRRQHRDFETDELLGALTTAFALRPKDRGALSLTWVEYFGKFSAATCAQAADAYRKCTRDQKLSKNAIFAIGQVALIKAASKQAGHPARVLHERTKCNPAHATIRRIEQIEFEMLDVIAQQAFTELRDQAGKVACASPAMGIAPII